MPTPIENYEGRPIIIYGPQGSGTTRNAALLAKHFGKTTIVDEWFVGDVIVDNALHLTNDAAAKCAVCYTRKGKLPAYVLHLERLTHIPGVTYTPTKVQTSAQGEQA